MNYLPSKELVSEVLDTTITELAFKNNYVEYTSSISGNPYCYITYDKINIYELAYMCKVWAKSQKLFILSLPSPNEGLEGYWANLTNNTHRAFAATEPEAIFAACQWIIDNRS